jgi:hypothetical protein
MIGRLRVSVKRPELLSCIFSIRCCKCNIYQRRKNHGCLSHEVHYYIGPSADIRGSEESDSPVLYCVYSEVERASLLWVDSEHRRHIWIQYIANRVLLLRKVQTQRTALWSFLGRGPAAFERWVAAIQHCHLSSTFDIPGHQWRNSGCEQSRLSRRSQR